MTPAVRSKVSTTVHFDDKLNAYSDKVTQVPTLWHFSSKVDTQLIFSQSRPEFPSCVGGRATQISGSAYASLRVLDSKSQFGIPPNIHKLKKYDSDLLA